MEKAKTNLLIAFVVVTLVCIILVVNAIALNTQLNALRPKAAKSDALESELADLKVKYDGQARLIRDLQNSLDIARRDAESLRGANASLKATNTDLEARLNAALTASQASAGETTKVSAPAAE
jgi:biopolymer transport protein ExbB/TolQ